MHRTLEKEWEAFFAACKKRGLSATEIRQSILKEGYDEEYIDNLLLIHGLHDTRKRTAHDPLQDYLEQCEAQGRTMAEAKQALVQSGHPAVVVDAVIQEYRREKHLSTAQLQKPAEPR